MRSAACKFGPIFWVGPNCLHIKARILDRSLAEVNSTSLLPWTGRRGPSILYYKL